MHGAVVRDHLVNLCRVIESDFDQAALCFCHRGSLAATTNQSP
jgi:hypothetical protein